MVGTGYYYTEFLDIYWFNDLLVWSEYVGRRKYLIINSISVHINIFYFTGQDKSLLFIIFVESLAQEDQNLF